jgi:hypothetical protein
MPGMITQLPFTDIAATVFQLQPREDGSGFRVKETETHWIEVLYMIWNWRIVRTPKCSPGTYDRGWCYFGTDLLTFAAAVLAASAWDGADDSEPAGYSKNAMPR